MRTLRQGVRPWPPRAPPPRQNTPLFHQVFHRGARSHHTEADGLRQLLLSGAAHGLQRAQNQCGCGLYACILFCPSIIKVVLINLCQYSFLLTECQARAQNACKTVVKGAPGQKVCPFAHSFFHTGLFKCEKVEYNRSCRFSPQSGGSMRGLSSVGQSSGLISRWSRVRVPEALPVKTAPCSQNGLTVRFFVLRIAENTVSPIKTPKNTEQKSPGERISGASLSPPAATSHWVGVKPPAGFLCPPSGGWGRNFLFCTKSA